MSDPGSMSFSDFSASNRGIESELPADVTFDLTRDDISRTRAALLKQYRVYAARLVTAALTPVFFMAWSLHDLNNPLAWPMVIVFSLPLAYIVMHALLHYMPLYLIAPKSGLVLRFMDAGVEISAEDTTRALSFKELRTVGVAADVLMFMPKIGVPLFIPLRALPNDGSRVRSYLELRNVIKPPN